MSLLSAWLLSSICRRAKCPGPNCAPRRSGGSPPQVAGVLWSVELEVDSLELVQRSQVLRSDEELILGFAVGMLVAPEVGVRGGFVQVFGRLCQLFLKGACAHLAVSD